MHLPPIRFDLQSIATGWTRPSVVAWSGRIAFLALALSAGGLVARAEDDAARPTDFLERVARRHAAAQRIEELEQEAWKAVATDGDFAAATASMSKAAELARSEFGVEHWLTKLKQSLASGVKSLTELPPAQRTLFVEAVKGQSLSGYLWSNGKRERALAQMRQAQEKREQALGADHVLSAYSLLGLIYNECQMREFRLGERDAVAAVGVLKTAWGEKNPGYAHALFYQGIAESGLHDLEAAEQHFREALEILEPVAREGISSHYMLMYAGAQLQLAHLLNDQERYADAEPFARRASEIYGFAAGQTYTDYLNGQLDLSRSLSGQGKNAEAEILFTCLINAAQPNAPPHDVATILGRYAEHLRRIHRDSDAEQIETFVRKVSARNPSPKSNGNPATEPVPLADIPRTARKN